MGSREYPPSIGGIFFIIDTVMNQKPAHKKLRALPLQCIELSDGVLLKRGCTVLKINGAGAAQAVNSILTHLTTEPSSTEEIVQTFAEPSREAVRQILARLQKHRMVVPADSSIPPAEEQETALDIFYWHFGETTKQVEASLSTQRLVILGVNDISRQLSMALIQTGAKNFCVVDAPLLRNIRLFADDGTILDGAWPTDTAVRPLDYGEWSRQAKPSPGDCLIATSDFGGHAILKDWNSYCIQHQCHFLPVSLHDQIGYVGPLVIPGETACFECLLLRQNSHHPDLATARAIQAATFGSKVVTGHHPSMASILGDVAAIELTKFYGGNFPAKRAGTVIEVNLLASRMTPRKVLKVPRCRVCSELMSQPSTNPSRAIFSTYSGMQQ